MSAANEGGAVSEKENEGQDEAKKAQEPHIQVLKGNPTDEELAAVVAVLAAASSKPEPPREQEENLWGHPVDRLRYPIFSWQRVTLLERTHMRRR
ncbi:hypothetical protein MHAS44199_15110 [Mycolicibacterium hassiacum DSM 44199]|nr:hypothetical protein [Mycolicibacterium hassiacum DSM 44199]